jgi:hypothetical protein
MHMGARKRLLALGLVAICGTSWGALADPPGNESSQSQSQTQQQHQSAIPGIVDEIPGLSQSDSSASSSQSSSGSTQSQQQTQSQSQCLICVP